MLSFAARDAGAARDVEAAPSSAHGDRATDGHDGPECGAVATSAIVDEEDAEEKREDNFERSYNFRFEEAGATQLVGHARCSLAGVELALGAHTVAQWCARAAAARLVRRYQAHSIRRQAALGRKREAEAARRERWAEQKRQKVTRAAHRVGPACDPIRQRARLLLHRSLSCAG